jgi:hypothetical protein
MRYTVLPYACWPARLVGATTSRVRPTPERPLSPWVISTVLHRPAAIAAAVWQR